MPIKSKWNRRYTNLPSNCIKKCRRLVFFAGHGIEVDGQNYLLPISKNFESETDVQYEGVNAGRVMSGMGRAGNGLNMVILDACRIWQS